MPSDNQDVPLAKVFGPGGQSEVVLALTALSGLLIAIFGQDWGIRAHAQDIAAWAFVVGPPTYALVRGWKHHSVNKANAVVLAARQAAPLRTVPVQTDNRSRPEDGKQDLSQSEDVDYSLLDDV